MRIAVIIAAGGRGLRLGAPEPKQFLALGARTLLEWSVAAFRRHPRVGEVVVVLPPERVDEPPAFLREAGPCPVVIVAGGARRQDSVRLGLARCSGRADIVLVHDAARPFVSDALIGRMIDAAAAHGAAIAALPVRDTVKRGGPAEADGSRPVAATLPREEIFLAQTPQAFRCAVLEAAYAQAGDADATDEAAIVERAGGQVWLVEGDPDNVKVTTVDDLAWARGRAAGAPRVGVGYDLHRLVAGRPLLLGGVRIPHETGLDGHSDADIVCHAVTDAVLGAAALGDIGRLFPDTDPRWKDADSLALLRGAIARVHDAGFRVGNVDVTVIAQRPKLLPFVEAIRANLAAALAVPVDAVSVKGKTNEGVDSMGRGESMACHAVATVTPA
ncbi:MAG: 2-C-methyl-D-erythritol 4-phosphate cytidylyltransferase [Vicinamibacterales bacterium]